MNVSGLQYLLQHPDALSTTDKTVLDQLARDYPYFPTAYLLLAKKSQLQRETSFESKLNLAAAYSIDRLKLYEFLHETYASASQKMIAQSKQEVETETAFASSSSNLELDELLKSIHDRKQQILGTGDQEPVAPPNIFDGLEQPFLDDLKGAGSEFAPVAMEFSEGEAIDAGIESAELKVIKELELEIEEQVAYYRNEEFLAVNETAGDGEYVPLDELLSEEEENAFVEESDPEVESISVIEEEFILRDIDLDLKVYELGNISAAENFLQLELENAAAMEITADPELEALKEMEQQLQQQETFDREEELEIVNRRAGGGLEFSPLTLNEESDQTDPVLISESASIFEEESGSLESSHGLGNAPEAESLKEEDSSLRFNENVTSPGEFLPGKSYSFLDWLQFFKPEKTPKTTKKPDKVHEPVKKQHAEEEKTEDTVRIRTGLQEELETIDRIVSTIRHEPSERPELLFSPADLAKKSIEMDDEMVTETLATIYESQGLFDKAIRMYARLSLKFPEKSLFFAARIKELKSKK
ncbi:MAG: hypothetical protein ABIO46_09915 [Chitinophagales bacterium]